MRDTKQEVIKFWFEETSPQQWFQKNDDFDMEIKERFMVSYEMACKDMCSSWCKDAEGVLALCLIFDQFPRNMFRGHEKSFATDQKALLIVKEALHKGFDQLLSPVKRRFIYMPFMHSESLQEQRKCVSLFNMMKDDDPMSYEYACRHLKVIEQFGRFPHRNDILGREGTDDEKKYLQEYGVEF